MLLAHVPYNLVFGRIFHYATELFQDTAPTEAFPQRSFHAQTFYSHTHTRALDHACLFHFVVALLYTKAYPLRRVGFARGRFYTKTLSQPNALTFARAKTHIDGDKVLYRVK